MSNFQHAALVTVILAAVAVPVASLSPASTQLPPRDARGTARVSGVVSGVDRAPIAGVTLTLMSSTWKKTIAVSDDHGWFAFSALAADLYYLRAEKTGFLDRDYGALRPGGEGTPIALAAAQLVDDLTITLVRTGTIGGTVKLADGKGVAGVTVQLTPKDGLGIAAVAHTNERGVYRLEDVWAGEYKVHAMPGNERAAVPVFHPGTTSPVRAATLRIHYGEERNGIDITLVDERPANLAGTVLDLAGLPAEGVQLFAVPIAWGGGSGSLSLTTDSNGEFVYADIFPGRYSLKGYVTSAPDVLPSDPATLWVTATVDVPLEGPFDLTLRLQPPLVFSGRVRFVGATRRHPSDLSAVRINLQQDSWKPTPVEVAGDGSFARSVLPGSYQLEAFIAESAPGWVLRSAVRDGRDLLDAPLELSVATGSLTDVELTFSDQPTTLSGVISTAAGAPLSACYVVALPADRALWSASYRRLAYRRPATNGRYVFEDLLPGEYLLAVVPDLDTSSWRAREYLDSLVDRATRVTLRDGDRKTQDIRVGGR